MVSSGTKNRPPSDRGRGMGGYERIRKSQAQSDLALTHNVNRPHHRGRIDFLVCWRGDSTDVLGFWVDCRSQPSLLLGQGSLGAGR